MLAGHLTNLDLAPPEIIDWSRVVGFRYHYDAYKKFTRSEVQLPVYVSELLNHEDDVDAIDVDYLKARSIRAIDASGQTVRKWSVWKCITGELEYGGTTYVIDEGEIFEVAADYLESLNENITRLPLQDALPWPAATTRTDEDTFSRAAAVSLAPALRLDQELVYSRMQTTPIEL